MEPKPIVVQPGHYPAPLNIVGERLTILASGERYELFHQAGPEGIGSPPHFHPWDESFFVTKVAIDIGFGSETIHGKPGTLVHLPAGTLHWFRFREGGGEMISISSAGSVAKFFTQASEEIDPAAPNLERLVEIGGRHGLRFPGSE